MWRCFYQTAPRAFGGSFKNRKPIGEIRFLWVTVWFLCGDVPGFSRVMLDGLWIPTSWKISREMCLLFFFLLFLDLRGMFEMSEMSLEILHLSSPRSFFGLHFSDHVMVLSLPWISTECRIGTKASHNAATTIRKSCTQWEWSESMHTWAMKKELVV